MFNGERYRIIGLFNNVSTSSGNKDLVRIVKGTYSSNAQYWNNSYFTLTGSNNRYYPNYFVRNNAANDKSTIYTYLNTTFYNTLGSTYRNYIQSVNWNLGAIENVNNTATEFYEAEHGNTASSDYSVTSFDYNIGLFYPSDFGFAYNDSTCLSRDLGSYASNNACYSNNWMNSIITSNAWTMTSSTYYTTSQSGNGNNRRTNYIYYTFYLGSNRNLVRQNTYSNGNYRSYAVYPSFYLKDDVTISSGDGSYDNPYVIGSSDDKLTDIIYEIMHPTIIDPGNTEYIEHEESEYQEKTYIRIQGGTISGSVYGAGNSNGIGNDANNRIALGKINIEMVGGIVEDSIYGGSNELGIVYGDVFIDIINGEIVGSVYGGGKGGYTSSSDGTYVAYNVNVNIGSEDTTKLNINGNVYGGSAFGTVNAVDEVTTTSSYYTHVTVNDGVVTGSVFGGGKGSSTYTPKVVGDINVTINGGDITNVFGGNDQAGSHTKLNEVYLNGGIIDSVYGGGNMSSVTNTHVYLDGSTVNSLYGGSNTLGDVSTTHVNIESGTVANVYGGNNEGGTCGTTNILVQGTASVTSNIYSGGNKVATTTTNVTLNSANGTIPSVYGGGNAASVTTSNVYQNGVTVTNLYGGSNSSGTVTTSNITHTAGSNTNIFGGNNAGGNTLTSYITFSGGNTTNIYGGGNNANGNVSNVTISGGVATNIYGGGNNAGLTTSNIEVNSGSVTNIYGGSNNTGTVSTTNVTINNASNTITALYGGGNRAQVGYTNVEINGGTISNVYGGGNLAQVNNDTSVDINGGTINTNIYGGGNFGVVVGSSNVTITDATILGSAYAGGNGTSAILQGNTNITIDGSTVIGTPSSVAPTTGSVFGGGNQAATGISGVDTSTSTVNIAGATIYGNVYGGANTSVINGNTIVNIGNSITNINSLDKDDIHIYGHIFGGGEANASGSEIYDWGFISVTQGTDINIDATLYNNFLIDGSFYGGGNASSATGDSYLYITNYGSSNNPKKNISIQRVTYAILNNSSVLLKGAIDRANDYDTELFSISRVEELTLKNNSELFLETGANLLESFYSLDSSDNPAVVNIDVDNNSITTRTVDNRIYMYEGKNLNIAKDQQVTDYGEVIGMTFLGMFNYGNNNEINYIEPTPASASFYMWYIGESVLEYNVNLVASKYSTLGSVELPFLDFSAPNTSFQIVSFDSTDIASGISLVDKNSIPRIASSENDANTIFGLTMEASNNGWLTTGKTSFYTTDPYMGGITYYEGENSTVVPTMLFYLHHSKNLTEAKDLGTVRISVVAITKINALSNDVNRLVINVNMSSALFQTNEYEGAMTPGDKYELFTSTSNNITTKSKLSAYYALYGSNTNLYPTGYHRVLTSSFVLPLGTKITMLDFVQEVPEYYYHVIDSTDVSNAQTEFSVENECSYALSLFTKMGSKSNNSNYDDATMNAIYYDGTDSSEEFIFIVDFSDTTISTNMLDQTLLIEIRDINEESMISVLGMQHSQLTYSLYANMDSQIDISAVESENPLYIGYDDIFDVTIDYQSSTLSNITITDTQYFDSKLGVQIYILNSEGNVVSGTDLTGTYFTMDGVTYYPDISGYTHIKLADRVGNIEKWIIFNTDNSSLATGSYTFVIEAFASADGIYYSRGNPEYYEIDLDIINSQYGLNPVINDNSVIFSANNDKNLSFTIAYTSLLDNPNIRLAMYRRKYDEIYDINYQLVDFADYVDQTLFSTNNTYEYMLISNPSTNNEFTIVMDDELLTGTYRLAFRLYDGNTQIGEVIRYIIIK